jgi:MinD-like ATPase involved in chromosome partitioning or flagellar assembly
MTTSYKLKALQELKANKKLEREKEAIEFKAKEEAEAKAHAENLKRIAKKMAIIEAGGVVPNPKPVVEEKPVKKATATVKKVVKKTVKKKGRPAGSKNKKK